MRNSFLARIASKCQNGPPATSVARSAAWIEIYIYRLPLAAKAQPDPKP
jgi:hypothetical protein